MKLTSNSTRTACYAGYIIQAVVNNLIPLLFTVFNDRFDISLSRLAIIVTVNFCTQIAVDIASAWLLKKIGYRTTCILAHVFSIAGLAILGILPENSSNPFLWICIAAATCAVGGGILEVAISPLIEAIPSDNKEKEMSLLHSFYCWGHMGVVLLTTAFLAIFGKNNWKYLPFVWAILPLVNGVLFSKVPLWDICPEEKGLSLKQLFKMPVFYLFIALMICSGASEQAISQWSSFFAEKGLGLSKAMGDILGPCAFALCMGSARAIYAATAHKIKIKHAILFSSLLCTATYAVMGLVDNQVLSVIACALNGFSVGVLWPGVYSLAAAKIKNGGTNMFSILAFGGDIGCALGPFIVGQISDATLKEIGQASSFAGSPEEAALKSGIAVAVVFPILLTVLLFGIKNNKQKE